MRDPLLARAVVAWVGAERSRRQETRQALRAQGYYVVWAKSLTELIRASDRSHLEILLIELEGLQAEPLRLVRRIRRTLSFRELPVVFLSAPGTPGTELSRALEGGADDWLPAAAPAQVLAARLEAALATFRQFSQPRSLWSQHVLRSKDGRLVLDLKSSLCHVQEGSDYEDRRLTSKEIRVLALLLRRAPAVVRWQDFWTKGWRPPRLGARSRTVVQHVMRLRQALGSLGRRIETVPGTGYRWVG